MRERWRFGIVAVVTASVVVATGSVPGASAATIAVPQVATAPGPVTSVAAAPTAAGVTVSWQAPSSNGGSPLTGYVLTPSVGSPVKVDPSESSEVVDEAPGTAVTVQVTAVNAVGSSTPVISPSATAAAPGGLVRVGSPQRLVDSRSGKGVAKGALAPQADKVVQVTGAAGVPKAGVAAVYVNVMALDVAATTSLRVWPDDTSAPSVATIMALPGERVTQLVEVPVSTLGRIRVRNGSGATDVVMDVFGYVLTAAASGSSRNGMVTATTPTPVIDTRTGQGTPKAKLGAGKYLDVTVAGVGGVPTSGASAVLLDLSAFSPSAITGLTVYAPGPLPATQNLSAVPGASRTNLVLVPLAASGKVRIENQFGTVDVKLDVAGWVSNGTADVGADSVNAGANRLLADTSIGSGTPKVKLAKGADLTLTVAGTAGVPATTSTTPATGVLLYVRLTTTAYASLSVRPAGTAASSLANVVGRPGQVMGNTVFVPLPASGKIAIHNSPGSVSSIDVRVEVVGWTGGSVLLDPHTRVLDPATTSAIHTITPTSVSFAASGGSASSLAPGDIIVAGITAKTPSGLLRRVSSVSTAAGIVTATTTAAGLADAVRSGDTSTGPAPTSPPPLPTQAEHAKAKTGASHSDVSLGGGFGLDVPFDETLGGSIAQLAGDASVSASASIGVHIHWWSLSVEADVSAQVSESFDAALSVTAPGSYGGQYELGELKLANLPVDVAGVPFVVTPFLSIGLGVNGSAGGTVSAGIHQSFGFGLGMKITPDGVTPTTHVDGPNLTFTPPSSTGAVTATAELEPSFGILIDDSGSISASISPDLKLESDQCTVTLKAGLEYTISVGLSLLEHWEIEESLPAQTIVDKELAHVDIPYACPHWTGTVTWTGHLTQAVNDINETLNGSLTANGKDPSVLTESEHFTEGTDCGSITTDRSATNSSGSFDPRIDYATDHWAFDEPNVDQEPNFPNSWVTSGCWQGLPYSATGTGWGISWDGFNVAQALHDAILANPSPEGSTHLSGTYHDTLDIGGDGGTLDITYDLTRQSGP